MKMPYLRGARRAIDQFRRARLLSDCSANFYSEGGVALAYLA
jgi:hypothetical protein